MIKKLRRRLTLFLSLVLAAVIICMSVMLAYANANEYQNSMYSSYSQDTGLLYSYLTQSSLIDASTIGRYVRSNYYIRISANQETVYETEAFPHADELAELASPYRLSDYWTDYYDFLDNGTPVRKEYTYKYGHTTYWNSYFLLNMGSSILTVHIIYNNQVIQEHNAKSAALYLAVACAAILLLAVFSRIFIGRVLVPVEEAYRKQDEFIAVASHELKAPLTIIKSCMYSFKGSGETDEQADDCIALADRECSHMAEIVDNLLSFARIKRSDRAAFAPADPVSIVIECYSRFETLAMDKGIELLVALPENPLPAVIMDRDRMLRCLSILTDNAIAYTERGSVTLSVFCADKSARRAGLGSIRHRASRRRHDKTQGDTSVVFQVADTGSGIPDDEKQKIFDKFYSTHRNSAPESGSHAGLGLAIAAEIARLHGTEITVRDNEPCGSVFEVRV